MHKTIVDSSKGSEFYKQEEEKLHAVKEKVNKYKNKVELIKKDPKQWSKINKEVAKRIDAIQKERAVDRTWIHCDMDAFYAAVEI